MREANRPALRGLRGLSLHRLRWPPASWARGGLTVDPRWQELKDYVSARIDTEAALHQSAVSTGASFREYAPLGGMLVALRDVYRKMNELERS